VRFPSLPLHRNQKKGASHRGLPLFHIRLVCASEGVAQCELHLPRRNPLTGAPAPCPRTIHRSEAAGHDRAVGYVEGLPTELDCMPFLVGHLELFAESGIDAPLAVDTRDLNRYIVTIIVVRPHFPISEIGRRSPAVAVKPPCARVGTPLKIVRHLVNRSTVHPSTTFAVSRLGIQSAFRMLYQHRRPPVS
jgi:hypothetical protein